MLGCDRSLVKCQDSKEWLSRVHGKLKRWGMN
jgi:translation initiation factor IF-1